MTPKSFLTVEECKACTKTPLIDLSLFLTTKLLPIYVAGTLITGAMVIALAVAGLIQKIIEGFIKGYFIDNCLEAATARHVPVADKRVVVEPAKTSPTLKRVRKRMVPNNSWGAPFEPGGGSFGGSGAGADWGEPLIEPITGLPIYWEPGNNAVLHNPETHQLMYEGNRSRPLAGMNSWKIGPGGALVADQVSDPNAFHQIEWINNASGARERQVGNFLLIDGQRYGLFRNEAAA